MKYELDQKAPFFINLLYGAQWWMISLPSIIIIGTIISQIHYTDIALQTIYMQKVFAIMGLTTIAQIVFGHRLPLVIGPASVLLIGVLASLSAEVSVIYTAIMVGGAIISVIAFSGLLARVKSVFTPRIITVILILIPFTLTPSILKLIFGNEHHTLFNVSFAAILLLSLLLLNQWLKGVWKSATIVLGLTIGSLVYYALVGFPQVETVSYSKELFINTLFIKPTFDAGAIIAFLFCFIALLVNELGSIGAMIQMLRPNNINQRINRGVGIVGLSNILSGSVGTIGAVDYSMSAGVISSTGCASRYTLIPAGIGLLACAFFPKVITLLNHIPSIVMGILLLYLMSMQLSAGLTMLIKENAISVFEDGIVVGLPLMVAILITFMPAVSLNQLSGIMKPIMGNGFVVGTITVFLLEHLVFKKPKNNT